MKFSIKLKKFKLKNFKHIKKYKIHSFKQPKEKDKIILKKEIENYNKFKKPHDYIYSTDKLCELISGISKNVKKYHIHKPYFTKTTKNIIETVNKKYVLLKNNLAIGSGNSSSIIYGQKGIGKSTALYSAAISLNFVSEDVIPIYIDYTTESMSLNQFVNKALIERKIIKNNIDDWNILSETIFKKNKKIFLIVDELDKLYQTDCIEHLTILNDLCFLGSDIRGIYYTMCCGSSTHLYNLITKNAIHDKELAIEYPLLKNAPNLNGSKFYNDRLELFQC